MPGQRISTASRQANKGTLDLAFCLQLFVWLHFSGLRSLALDLKIPCLTIQSTFRHQTCRPTRSSYISSKQLTNFTDACLPLYGHTKYCRRGCARITTNKPLYVLSSPLTPPSCLPFSKACAMCTRFTPTSYPLSLLAHRTFLACLPPLAFIFCSSLLLPFLIKMSVAFSFFPWTTHKHVFLVVLIYSLLSYRLHLPILLFISALPSIYIHHFFLSFFTFPPATLSFQPDFTKTGKGALVGTL